jgi:hypothetical protein
LLPEARGQRSIARYLAIVRTLAADLHIQKLACVSVYNTTALWARYGFKAGSGEALSPEMTSHGATAKYIVAEVLNLECLGPGALR